MNESGQKEIKLKPGEVVAKDYGPAGTSGRPGTGSSIANMSRIELATLTGAASPIGTPDPLAGRFAVEGSDAAERIRQLNEEHIRKLHGEGTEQFPIFQKGDKVYHKRKKKECKVVKVLDDKHLVLRTDQGKQFDAHVDNVVRL